MITDARVLQPEFIPREVQHRDAEVNYLSSVLDSITHGERADPALLHGPSGVGKTCIAQFLVERLREEVVDLNYQYVNCWEDHSRFKTLYRLLDGIDQTVDVHRQSTPKDVLLERLRDSGDTPYVVILDEVDQLEDKSLLYDLYRIPHLTMILISNDEDDLFASTDDRLRSRLTDCERIHFRPYHESELVAILRDRVRWGLTEDIIDTSRLELIAANAGGDARVAIGILRRAARKARASSADEITADIIEDETPEAKSEIKQRTVDRLTPHQELLYDIITEHGEIPPQQLYDAYTERADDPKTKRMVRNYLSKLEHYNLITAEGNTKARNLPRTRIISPVILGRRCGFGNDTRLPIVPKRVTRCVMSDPPRDNHPNPSSSQPDEDSDVGEVVRDRITNRAFTEWYSEQQYQANILEGKEYFNSPSPAKDPDHHTPSKLLQCHRKAIYARQNAPREGTPPEGLFWIGSEFEEQVIVPFLQSITTPETYVTNSLWIDTEIDAGGTEYYVRGATDPVIATAEAEPLFVTEIKTTTSLDNLSGPKPHHRAQLHAYLYALNQEYDHEISDGMIVYGSRTTLDIEPFYVEFDPAFWQRIIDWIQVQAEYEQADELPRASPERDWECEYCSFKHRCGKADTPYADIDTDGLLPVFDGYDRQNLHEYLEAHADRDARLTPTLAHHYPDLAAEFGAYDWSCSACDATFEWHEVDWNGNMENLPYCPNCVESGKLITLSGPEPEAQLTEP